MKGGIYTKDIEGYEGLYAVTSCGKVWSYKRKRFLKPTNNSSGYPTVKLSKDDTQKTFILHRLVAKAYLSNPEHLPLINHKDEIKEHCWVGNLEWCDYQYNNTYNGLHDKVTEKIMKPVYCVELGVVFKSQDIARKETGAGHISECCTGKYKTSGGYHWEFYNPAS